MKMKYIRLAKTLTFLGVIPFIAPIIAHLFGVRDLHLAQFALNYGAVIAAFLCGIHWGLFLAKSDQTRVNLLITSNAFTLLAWSSLLTLIPRYQYFIQIVCFSLLLMIDIALGKEGVIPRWFVALRKVVTGIVLMSLVLMAWIRWTA
jgi:hypothetical protein